MVVNIGVVQYLHQGSQGQYSMRGHEMISSASNCFLDVSLILAFGELMENTSETRKLQQKLSFVLGSMECSAWVIVCSNFQTLLTTGYVKGSVWTHV